MQCAQAQELFLDALKEGAGQGLSGHFEKCEECRGLFREMQETAGRVHEIPDIEVDDEVLRQVRGRITLERGHSFRLARFARFSLFAGVAATLLVAFVILIGQRPARVVAFVTAAAENAPLKPETELRAGVVYAFPAYSDVLLPAIGTLRVREGTRLSFESRNVVRLEAGEIFLDIDRKPQDGFRVRTDRFLVSVRGTRFGVRPDTVYVAQGSVNVQVDPRTVEPVRTGEVIEVSGDRTVSKRSGTRDEMAWIVENDPADLRLIARVSETLRVDRVRRVSIQFSNPSRMEAVFLRPPKAREDYLALSLDLSEGGPQISLQDVRIVRSTHDASLLRVDAESPLELEVEFKPELFDETVSPGRYAVRIVYTSGGHADPRLWQGTARSELFEIEIVR